MCIKKYDHTNNTTDILLCYDDSCKEFKKNYFDKYWIEWEPVQENPIDVFIDEDKIYILNEETKEYHICNKTACNQY